MDPNLFIECDSCRAKPGTPVLCAGCLHNRAVIERLHGPPWTSIREAEALRVTFERRQRIRSLVHSLLLTRQVAEPYAYSDVVTLATQYDNRIEDIK
jgi:hypothetical protein